MSSSAIPDNYVLHVHDGFVYAFTLDDDGDLAQVPNLGLKPDSITANLTLAWDRVEKCVPQTGVERDEHTGEQYGPEPTQCAYIASAHFMLAEVEGKREVETSIPLPEKLAVQARHLLVSTEAGK